MIMPSIKQSVSPVWLDQDDNVVNFGAAGSNIFFSLFSCKNFWHLLTSTREHFLSSINTLSLKLNLQISL